MERSSCTTLALLFFCSLAALSSAVMHNDVHESSTFADDPTFVASATVDDDDPTKPREYQIVLSGPRPKGVDSRTYDINLLTFAIGSKKAAAKAITYSSARLDSFIAILTPPQAAKIWGLPHVIFVFPVTNHKADDGPWGGMD